MRQGKEDDEDDYEERDKLWDYGDDAGVDRHVQGEDGIRDSPESGGLGDVYNRHDHDDDNDDYDDMMI